MYKPLIDAPFDKPLVLVKVENPDLAMRLSRMGLFEGSELLRLDEDVLIQPVRVRGPGGEFILGGGMAGGVVVHLDDGRKLPLVEMKPGESGHIEGTTCGSGLIKTLNTFGFKIDDEISFVRRLPSMEYITIVEKESRIRLTEGMAAKIWGRMQGRTIQFASAQVKEEFEVLEILGGFKAEKMLFSRGVEPGKILILEGVEQAKNLFIGNKDPLIISTPDGLRLFLQEKEGKRIFVKIPD